MTALPPGARLLARRGRSLARTAPPPACRASTAALHLAAAPAAATRLRRASARHRLHFVSAAPAPAHPGPPRFGGPRGRAPHGAGGVFAATQQPRPLFWCRRRRTRVTRRSRRPAPRAVRHGSGTKARGDRRLRCLPPPRGRGGGGRRPASAGGRQRPCGSERGGGGLVGGPVHSCGGLSCGARSAAVCRGSARREAERPVAARRRHSCACALSAATQRGQ